MKTLNKISLGMDLCDFSLYWKGTT